MYYKKSRHNFFRNIFNNRMSIWYLLIIMIFAVCVAFVAQYLFEYRSGKFDDGTVTVPDNVIASTTSDNTNVGEPSTISPIVSDTKYELNIDIYNSLVYVYEIIEKTSESKLVKCFECSIGNNVSPGSDYSVGDKYLWKPTGNNHYSQYATRISKNLCIQSIPYESANKDALIPEYYENLRNATEDSNVIYLLSGDAYWIYNNCNVGTTVKLYDEGSTVIPDTDIYVRPDLLWCISWDPTDPDSKNVWCPSKVSHYDGVRAQTIPSGSYFNPMDGVVCYDTDGKDITNYTIVEGTLDINTPGVYTITYVTVDIHGGNLIWDALITVE